MASRPRAFVDLVAFARPCSPGLVGAQSARATNLLRRRRSVADLPKRAAGCLAVAAPPLPQIPPGALTASLTAVVLAAVAAVIQWWKLPSLALQFLLRRKRKGSDPHSTATTQEAPSSTLTQNEQDPVVPEGSSQPADYPYESGQSSSEDDAASEISWAELTGAERKALLEAELSSARERLKSQKILLNSKKEQLQPSLRKLDKRSKRQAPLPRREWKRVTISLPVPAGIMTIAEGVNGKVAAAGLVVGLLREALEPGTPSFVEQAAALQGNILSVIDYFYNLPPLPPPPGL